MANIREFTNKVAGPTPSSAGANAMAELGARTVAAYNEIGNAIGGGIAAVGRGIETMKSEREKADRATTQKEMTTGLVTMLTAEDNLRSKWDELLKTSDPHDDSIQERFLAEADQVYAGIEGAMTKDASSQWAREQGARARSSLLRMTTADIALRAGQTVINDLNQAVNTAGRIVFENPGAIDDALAMAESTVNGIIANSGVSGETAVKLRADTLRQWQATLIENAMSGEIKLDPVVFLERAAAGDWDEYAGILGSKSVNGQTMPAVEAYKLQAEQVLQQRVAAKVTMDNQAYTQAQRLSEETKAKTVLELYDPQTNQFKLGPDTYDKIDTLVKDGTLTATDGAALKMQLGEAVNKPLALKDAEGLPMSLLKRANKQPGDPDYLSESELLSYVFNGKLTVQSYNLLKSSLSGGTDKQNFMATAVTAQVGAARSKIETPQGLLSGFRDAGQAQAADEMEADVRSRLLNAPDFATQQNMMTPGTKEYLFTPEYMQQWQERARQYGPMGSGGPGSPVGGGGTNTFGGGLLEGVPPPPRRPVDDIISGQQTAVDPSTTQSIGPIQTNFAANPAISAALNGAVNAAPGIGPAVSQPTPAGQDVGSFATENGRKTPLQIAQSYLGYNERTHTTVLSNFIKANTGISINPASTAWCAAWMNAILKASGYAGSTGNRLAARSFETYGTNATAAPKEGQDIAVFWRKSPNSGFGHVGIFMGYVEVEGRRMVKVLGGNQDDQVSITLEPEDRLLSIRRIPNYQVASK